MADDNDNNSDKERENVNYVRKKNLIPGWDNDHLIIGIGLLGLAAAVAPHLKNAIENVVKQYQPQLPPNGMQQPQQPVYMPPNVQQPLPMTPEHEHEHYERPNELVEHERALKEQQAYDAAMEKESVTGSSSMAMVPDRSTQVSKGNKNKGNYEAGSNISGSYS